MGILCHIGTQPGLTPAVPAPLGPGSPLPHLHWDRAHRCHICTGTGLTPATSTSTLGLGSPLPLLPWDRAHLCHICTRTGLTPATSTSTLGLGSPVPSVSAAWLAVLRMVAPLCGRPSVCARRRTARWRYLRQRASVPTTVHAIAPCRLSPCSTAACVERLAQTARPQCRSTVGRIPRSMVEPSSARHCRQHSPQWALAVRPQARALNQ